MIFWTHSKLLTEYRSMNKWGRRGRDHTQVLPQFIYLFISGFRKLYLSFPYWTYLEQLITLYLDISFVQASLPGVHCDCDNEDSFSISSSITLRRRKKINRDMYLSWTVGNVTGSTVTWFKTLVKSCEFSENSLLTGSVEPWRPVEMYQCGRQEARWTVRALLCVWF